MPTTVEEAREAQLGELLYLAGENADKLGIGEAVFSPRCPRRHPPP